MKKVFCLSVLFVLYYTSQSQAQYSEDVSQFNHLRDDVQITVFNNLENYKNHIIATNNQKLICTKEYNITICTYY